MEDPALSAMAHSALALIYQSNNDDEQYQIHIKKLDRFGGWNSVDSSWIEAINSRLNVNASMNFSEE